MRIVSDWGIRVSGFGDRVAGMELKVQGLGLRVSDFGFQVAGLRLGVWGFGVWFRG